MNRLLIAEDNAEHANALIRAVTSDPCMAPHIVHVTTLAELLKTAARDEPFDACILDLDLPDSHWKTTMGRMAELHTILPPIIATSALASTGETRAECLDNGAAEYISKERVWKFPYELVDKIDSAVRRARFNHREGFHRATA